MIPLCLLLLLAPPAPLELVNELFSIPSGEWRYVEFSLNQQMALVNGAYQVETGSARVRLALLRREDLERFRHDQPHGVIAVTPEARQGRLRFYARQPGDYVVLVDNRDGSEPANVRLRLTLDFSAERAGPEVTSLSPERRLTVILVSFVVFFGIATYSARRLLRAIRR